MAQPAPQLSNAVFTGLNVFGPEMQGAYARRAVVAWDSTIVGVLYKSNEMPDTPWWADQQLKEWLGEAFTSKSGEYSEAAKEFRARVRALHGEAED